jgi:hypothetical protein
MSGRGQELLAKLYYGNDKCEDNLLQRVAYKYGRPLNRGRFVGVLIRFPALSYERATKEEGGCHKYLANNVPEMFRSALPYSAKAPRSEGEGK